LARPHPAQGLRRRPDPALRPRPPRQAERARDIGSVPLIDASSVEPASVGDWPTWLRAAGLEDLPVSRIATFDSTKIAVQAAIDGMGVAIGSPGLFADDIAAGRLFQPFPLTVNNGKSYWIIYPEGAGERPKIRAFRDWVLEELRGTGREKAA